MKILALPDGRRISFDVIQNYGVSGQTLFFNTVTGVETYSCQTSARATTLLATVDTFAGDANTFKQLVEPAFITAVNSNPVVLPAGATAGQGAGIFITGKCFVEATLGTIWLEDNAGGLDDNGVSFTPTFISTTLLLGTFASWGDNPDNIAPVSFLYYRDSNSVVSNTIPVTITVI